MKYLTNKNENNFFLFPTNLQKIHNEIKKLNPKKSGGADNMSPKLIKSWSDTISGPISHIIKGIVHQNIIFSYMKVNKICNLDHPVY